MLRIDVNSRASVPFFLDGVPAYQLSLPEGATLKADRTGVWLDAPRATEEAPTALKHVIHVRQDWIDGKGGAPVTLDGEAVGVPLKLEGLVCLRSAGSVCWIEAEKATPMPEPLWCRGPHGATQLRQPNESWVKWEPRVGDVVQNTIVDTRGTVVRIEDGHIYRRDGHDVVSYFVPATPMKGDVFVTPYAFGEWVFDHFEKDQVWVIGGRVFDRSEGEVAWVLGEWAFNERVKDTMRLVRTAAEIADPPPTVVRIEIDGMGVRSVMSDGTTREFPEIPLCFKTK